MGRRQTGPRADRPGGVLQAVLKTRWPDGRVRMLRESLKTRDHTTALNRWPAAMQRLRARASGETKTTVLPMKPTDTGVEWDIPTLPDGTNDYDNAKPRVVTAAELLETEDLEIDWSRA